MTHRLSRLFGILAVHNLNVDILLLDLDSLRVLVKLPRSCNSHSIHLFQLRSPSLHLLSRRNRMLERLFSSPALPSLRSPRPLSRRRT